MILPLHIFTIVLDGMPFLPIQFSTFNRLDFPWTWHVVEGAAANVRDTGWCQPQDPRLSQDGSKEFLDSISRHPRVKIYRSPWWPQGKTEMVNAAVAAIKEPCLLMQIDADEIWLADQLLIIQTMFKRDLKLMAAQFYCRYFLGPNIVAGGDNAYGNRAGEWNRAWRFEPGMRFASHEPPVIAGLCGEAIDRDATIRILGGFDHYSWAFERHVAYKEKFYGYKGALNGWRQLQMNTIWPARLKAFLPWTDENSTADLLHNV